MLPSTVCPAVPCCVGPFVTHALRARHAGPRFDRLEDFVSDDENHRVIREHLSTCKLPCIPYLGMFLTDLTHIHVASSSVRESRQGEVDLMLDTIARFQQSEYSFNVVGFIRE